MSSIKKRSDTPAREEEPKKEKELEKELEKFRDELATARAQIGLTSQPITCIRLAITWIVEFSFKAIAAVLRSPLMWFVCVPGVALWFAMKYSLAPELFLAPVCGEKDAGMLWQVEFYFKEACWWIILGILSSVGFGTGLHSGIMFLFPHVMQVVAAAEACRTSTGLVAWYNHPCKLECLTTSGPKDDSTVTFLRLWLLVTVPCMLWGFGTAIGELPPYLVSKAARLGNKQSDFDAELEDAKSKTDVFSKMKIWTIAFTEKHGFLGVLLLASWPNAAFDMCGMCCGYLLMPFWTFFLATSCGKGLVKVNLQAIVFVNVFGSTFFQILCAGIDSFNSTLAGLIGKDLGLRNLAETARAKLVLKFQLQSRATPEKFMESASAQGLDLAALKAKYAKLDDHESIAARVLQEWDADKNGSISLVELKAAASRTDGKLSLSSLDPGTGINIMKMCWELFIVGLVLFFAVSVLGELARTKQAELDEETVAKKEKERRKKD